MIGVTKIFRDRFDLLLWLFAKCESNHRIEYGETRHVEKLKDLILDRVCCFFSHGKKGLLLVV